MAIRANLTGGAGGLIEADVIDGTHRHYKPRGLVTYQMPYLYETNRQVFATNEDNGNNMAVNGAISGATDSIHNGTDTVVWTGTNLSGTNFIFDSTTVAHTGTKSISAVNTVNNNVALFTRSTPLTTTTYNSLTGSIYLDSWSTSGLKGVQLAFRLAGVVVSATIELDDYINTTSTGSWLNFVIPLSSFGITGGSVDELTVTTVDVGAGPPPDYYLDDLLFTEGAGVVYVIEPTGENVLRVYGVSWTLVTAGTVALANGTAIGISYNKFGTLSALTNGILTRRIQFNETKFTNSTTQNSDIISGSDAELKTIWDDGVNTYMKFYTKFASPVDLVPVGNDRYEFVVQDDLSSVVALTVRADASVLTRPDGESL